LRTTRKITGYPLHTERGIFRDFLKERGNQRGIFWERSRLFFGKTRVGKKRAPIYILT
jgi:hypothetical protein